jgi:hypothetical protein
MADFMKILQQAQEMQGKLQQVQDELQQQADRRAQPSVQAPVLAPAERTCRRSTI